MVRRKQQHNKKRQGNSLPAPAGPDKTGGLIPDISGPSHPVTFSFQYAQLDCAKYGINGHCDKYFKKLLNRLKVLGSMTALEWKTNRSPALKLHPHTWSGTDERDGFYKILPPVLRDSLPYQFSITANEYGRIHGVIIGSLFYIVWFDRDHQVYLNK